MKKEFNNDEQRLLSSNSLDDLIRLKMEEELKAEFEKSKQKPKLKVVTDISQVPVELIFSKKAVYKVFNKINKTQTYINGVQAESMLGLQTVVRNKILAGQTDAFSTDNAYVKFAKVEC